ncbi:alpha/beta hydrolase family protein [Marisediminicola sp. LYQ134]|uniref:alpha/beta hydrolase family protein n=1 Tax=Marisediminicola sp. LYQ134 TaxID=3391061 RepID=UPI003982EDF7
MNRALLTRNSFWLALSLIFCLISGIGASLVQTSGGSTEVTELRLETSTGQALSALLFVPETATADTPAPGIVVSHGWWNNKEMQDANFVELSRRGFVVMSIDMYGHGDSDPLTFGQEPVDGTGMYSAVEALAALPYVDTERIGVEGHSNGARAANFSMPIDNERDEPLISSVLLVDNDGVYRDETADGAYFNLYGARDVGIVADQYDEFFFRSYDADGNAVTAPRDYITTDNAQSFLAFGADPAELDEERVASQFYTDDVDGTEALRIVYTPAETHPWGPFSKTTTGSVIEFFEESLGAPAPLASDAQVWQVKAFFNALGLVGFGIFLVAFTRAMLTTRAFASLAGTPAPRAVANRGLGLVWFWGGLAVSAVISATSWILLSQNTAVSALAFNTVPSIFTQGAVTFVAFWALVNGLAAIVIMGLSFVLFGRRHGLDLRATGVLPGWRKGLLGTLLGVITVVAAFGLVFVVDYLFTTDFRLWVLAVKAFTPDKIGIALLYLPFFLLFYVASSVAVNSFNRSTIAGREWLNTAVVALATALGALVLVIAQYTTFAATGELIPGFGGIFSIWLIPIIVILAASVVITRKIYRATGNPYIGGVINAGVATVISVTNTLTFT